jgi:UDP-N-acetylglucosamine 4,6-dehydratase/5-epimerase
MDAPALMFDRGLTIQLNLGSGEAAPPRPEPAANQEKEVAMDRRDVAKVVADKRILVTGGTGSFGRQIVCELLAYSPSAIYIFSRDEKKQWDMQQDYADSADVLRFILGDVRNYDRLREAFRGIDIVFHAAALKQVPNCEFAPYEAVRTNIIGAENVRRAAIEENVGTMVAISTDKAVKPVNVMGMSKALQERIMLHPVNGESGTRFVCVRYGNVLGSRGSIVPLFCEFIMQGKPIPITHPDMTRFQLTLQEAVQLVLWAAVKGKCGDLWVRKMPSARICDLARVLAYGLTGRRDYPQEILGVRPGEKMHEVLVSEEEMWRATELEDHFQISSWANSHDKAGSTHGPINEYASKDVHMLDDEELLYLLRTDGWVSANGGPGAKALRTASGHADEDWFKNQATQTFSVRRAA